MLNINNKFEIGQEVYTIERRMCPICNGKGIFYYKGYYIDCPKCKESEQGQWIVSDGTRKITGIRTNSHDGVNFTIRYNASGRKLAENRIFATEREAVEACDELNILVAYDAYEKASAEYDKQKENGGLANGSR